MASKVKLSHSILRTFVIILLLLFMLYIITFSNTCGEKTDRTARNGLFNLVNIEGHYQLAGEWHFFWKQFVYFDEMTVDLLQTSEFVSVPSSWNSYEFNDSKPKAFGYGTYVLELATDPGIPLGIRIPYISSSYKLFINENMLASSGTVATSQDKAVPANTTEIVSFTPETSNTLIILQVSNYEDYFGGMFSPLTIGFEETIEELRLVSVMREAFVIYCVLFFMIYHMFLFLKGRSGNEILWFILFCIIFVTILSIHPFSEMLLTYFYPNINHRVLMLLTGLTVAFTPIVLINFYISFFPDLIQDRIRTIVLALSIPAMALIPFLSNYHLLAVTHLFEVLIGLLLLVIFLLLAIDAIKGNENALIASISIVVFITPVFHDLLNFASVSNAKFMFYQSFLVYVLFNSYLISAKYINAYTKLEDIDVELKRDQLEIIQQGQLAIVGQIAGSIANQIRDPLGRAIKQMVALTHKSAELLQATKAALNDEIDVEKARRNLEGTKRIITQLQDDVMDDLRGVTNLVSGFRFYSALENSERVDYVNINKVLKMALMLIQGELEGIASIDASYEEVPMILVDEGAINQLILNIIITARELLQSSSGNGEMGYLRIRTSSIDKAISLTIEHRNASRHNKSILSNVASEILCKNNWNFTSNKKAGNVEIVTIYFSKDK